MNISIFLAFAGTRSTQPDSLPDSFCQLERLSGHGKKNEFFICILSGSIDKWSHYVDVRCFYLLRIKFMNT